MIELSRRAAEQRAQTLLTELEEEIAELRKRSAALSQLIQSEDCVHFFKVRKHGSVDDGVRAPSRTRIRSYVLQTFPGLSAHPPTKDWTGVCVEAELTSGAALGAVGHAVGQMQEEMQKLPESCAFPINPHPVPANVQNPESFLCPVASVF